ncbi:MAG: STAS domain-containing protein [Magnetococcales bacterium]|nr:STAS domain-containing protein [Magnetococcales bacterium]
MPVSSYAKDDTVFVKLSKSFTFDDHADFRRAALSYSSGTRFEVDFGDIEQIDSASIGMLLLLRAETGGEEANIALVNCRPNILKLFRMCQFGDLFRLH